MNNAYLIPSLQLDGLNIPGWAILAAAAAVVLSVVLLITFLFLKVVSAASDLRGGKSDAAKDVKAPKPKKEKKEKKSRKKKKDESSAPESPAPTPVSADSPQQEKESPSSVSSVAETADANESRISIPAESEQMQDAHEQADTTVVVRDEPSDELLNEVVEQLAEHKGVDLNAAKKKKPPKGKVKNLKKQVKSSQKNLVKKGARLQVPKTVQQSIPYYAVYEEERMIETKPGVFTRSYLLGDTNYQIAKDDEQQQMFMAFGQLLNSFGNDMRFEITINQKNRNMEEFERSTMLPLQEDGLDELRIERNNMLKKKLMEGKNHLVKEKYLTVSIKADSLEAAQTAFLRLDSEIDTNIKKIGQATATPLTTVQRLEILHDIYNMGDEGSFGNNMVRKEREDGKLELVFADERFDFRIMRRMGLTTKDMIGPSSFHFKGDHCMVGDTFCRVLYVRKLPTFLMDNVLAEFTDTEYNMITSIHYEPIDGEKAQKMIRRQLTNINANIVDKQKKASKAGYSPDLISPELRDNARETEAMLEDVNSKNQKLFYMTLVIAHFADSKEQLDSDTKAIQAIGRRLLCDVKVLNQQQEGGLNTALPLAHNQLSIKRTVTTESAAIFMPFVNQELNEPTGMYYGNNAVSHNLLKMDRRARKNGNGFIFGTPGSGKSMSAKQEMLTVLLSSPDTVVVIDPEGEYYPMAELLGGEVIRIAAGADVHINPFDIDLNAGGGDGKDDPMAVKSDFIVSLCETVVGERYGLAPQQRSIIDRCVRKVYEPYQNSRDPVTGEYDKSKLPTLLDFYEELRGQHGYEAMQLADGLEIYCKGSLNIFAHQTNVEYQKRFVVYDIKDVGATMKSMALLVVLDNIWNRMVEGREQMRYTWFFIDEIYLLFKNEASAEFLKNLYKRARKYYGLPTGITQNVSDLLENEVARTMISNCEYIQMLNQAPIDRAQLAELLNISPTQLGFVTNSNPGEGLIYDGKVIVPFANKLPKDTKQYMAMTTKPSEVKERETLKQKSEAAVQDTELSEEHVTNPQDEPAVEIPT